MRKKFKKLLSMIMVLAMVVTVCPQTQLFDVAAADENEKPYNLSEERPVYVSSGSNEDYAVDGNTNTRWQADQSDQNEWLYVDLGKVATIDHLYLHWEAAYAKYYQIQFSDDELNWTTVYTKGKNVGAYVDMAVSYNYTGVRDDGTLRFSVNWTSVEDAHYKVYVDGEIAKAGGDDYTFKDHGGTQGDIRFAPGEHELKVVAFNPSTNAELGSGTCTFNAQEGAKGDNGIVVDAAAALKQTIDASELSKTTARYVKIVTTERATAYGSSLYEFQVWGTGGANKPPVDYGTNLALNKKVYCSGTRDEWWMKDENGNITESAYNNVKPENAVDGDTSTSFTSYQGDDQWLYVDLGAQYDIGRVIVKFTDDGGKIFDVQVSSDAVEWTTIHRYLKGYPSMVDNFTCYQRGVRYVRVLAYAKVESGSGVGIRELEVYEYQEGDSKENAPIPQLPTRQIINNKNGKGSYISGEIKKELNKLPVFVNEENVKVPIDSNSWWSSAMIKTFGNVDCVHPLKAVYSKKGLGLLLASAGWVNDRNKGDLGAGYSTETSMDFYVYPDNYTGKTGYDRVEDYGDYSVKLGLCDEDGLKMTSTLVKGSPYVFTEYEGNQTVFISSSSITEFFDGNGKAILTAEGQTVTADHIGFTSVDAENEKAGNDGSYFAISAPEGTVFTAKSVGKNTLIKVEFPSAKETYMSFGAMTNKNQIEQIYRHGYAYVTNTKVGYTFNKATSKIVTTYTATTETKRSGFSNVTMQAFYPHQWKYSTDTSNPDITYPSIRGKMKGVFSNQLTTTQQFAGLLPTFTKPDSPMFDSAECIEYLYTVLNELGTGPNADAYWQGKAVHPLAISALMADQLGETEMRDGLLKDLKKIMVDWFTYDGGDDSCYFIYNKDWGTLYYPESSFGANAAICDHHFTYGYFMFGASVLASYDKEFYNDYKDMIELLVRDYANPEEPEDDGNMFCKFRAFDQYSGHSWAGGYADNDDGNNQESASESLFSWVGMYLWGETTKNDKYIDAGAYGFTTEMEAIEQYWFDYDGDNWLEKYPFEGTGQIYGGSYSYGTFFGGQPLFVYGIQWLPISEYLTNYGMNQTKCASMYQGLWDDTEYAMQAVLDTMEIKVEQARAAGQSEAEIQAIIDDYQKTYDEYATPDNGWQHITWPMLSQTNPQAAYDLFEENVSAMQKEDRANTLWFIAAMDQLGYRTNDYVITGDYITGSVYKKDGENGKATYTGEVWNPTDEAQKVTVIDSKGATKGTATVASGAFVSFKIDEDNAFELTQAQTPTIKATSLATGTVSENISGTVSFDDTQLIEIEAEEGATIYYTTDGSVPTSLSPVYEGKFLVSSDTSVKAIAVKEGFIDSAFASVTITIDGDVIQSAEDLSEGRPVMASSENGAEKAENANDGDLKTRWQAKSDDVNEWIQVDLGSLRAINTVEVTWEAAYAAKYDIQVSNDGGTWTTVANETGKSGLVQTTFDAVNARYVRIQTVSRGTTYGSSIYEIAVYGAIKANAPTISPASGIYNGSQTVVMSTAVKGAEVKYTLDGTDPTENSTTYTEPLIIDKSAIIRAVTYRKGMVLSDVTESSIIISGTISINKTSERIAVGRTSQLLALTDEAVTWSSSNDKVATVDGNGLVTAVSEGNATITARTTSGKTVTCDVTVTEAVHISEVYLKKTTLEMKNRTSETLEIVINPADTTDDKTVTWSSSDENVVTVNQSGTVTAKGEGQATITAKVGNFTATCEVTVGPAATVEEMVASSKYNLALNKDTSVYPEVAEGDKKYLNDGALTAGGNHCALSVEGWGYRDESYAIIDLGDTYDASTIDQILVQYKDKAGNDTVLGRNFNIQYSVNGVDFDVVYTSDTVEVTDFDDNCIITTDVSNVTGAVRYIKIDYPATADYGIQICEIAVLDTDLNAALAQVEMCANPADLIVTSDAIKTITYTIVPDVGQEDYKYMVYIDGKLVADRVDAGTYTVENIEAGEHTVKVVSYYNKLNSEGITKKVTVDDGSLLKYVDSVRNLAKGADVTVEDIYPNEGSQNPKTLTDGIIGHSNDTVVETMWGVKEATITLDLGRQIAKNQIQETLIAFKADNTNATDYSIAFSADGTNYETVIEVTGAAYKEALEDEFDASKYQQDTVRYVKVNLTAGNYNWGYQISEIAVMGTDVYMPEEVTGLTAIQTGKNTINVTWVGANNGQLYNVYVDNAIKGMNLATTTLDCSGIDVGTHTVKVTALLNGIESKGVTTTVVVTGDGSEVTTPEATTKEETTPEETETTTEEVVDGTIKVEGYQISTKYEGFRIVGSVEPKVNGKKVQKFGTVYAIKNLNGKTETGITANDLVVDSPNMYVAAYEATDAGILSTQMGDSKTATYYAMTMKFGRKNVNAFVTRYCVRTYALLEDGNYVYSDAVEFTVFDLAKYAYDNVIMTNVEGHNYLYDNILTVVDPAYQRKDFNWTNAFAPADDIG